MQDKKAFSLVELLVVMSVIAILLSMTAFGIQILNRNGRNAKRVDFVNDIKIGLEQYHQRNGKYPTKDSILAAFNQTDNIFTIQITNNANEDYIINYKDSILNPSSEINRTTTVYCYATERGLYTLGIKKEGGSGVWQDIGNNVNVPCDDTMSLVAGGAAPAGDPPPGGGGGAAAPDVEDPT
jgi:prepilin-type N-terminal cleavage/methylation domain-containing protein